MKRYAKARGLPESQRHCGLAPCLCHPDSCRHIDICLCPVRSRLRVELRLLGLLHRIDSTAPAESGETTRPDLRAERQPVDGPDQSQAMVPPGSTVIKFGPCVTVVATPGVQVTPPTVVDTVTQPASSWAATATPWCTAISTPAIIHPCNAVRTGEAYARQMGNMFKF